MLSHNGTRHPAKKYVFHRLRPRWAQGLTCTAPYTNGTSIITLPAPDNTAPSTQTTTTPTCVANCQVELPIWQRVYWQSLPINTTITAATVTYVVNNRTNSTRTVTNHAVLPSGYTVPKTNAAGTRITTVVRSDYIARTNFTTVLYVAEPFHDDPVLTRSCIARTQLSSPTMAILTRGMVCCQHRPKVIPHAQRPPFSSQMSRCLPIHLSLRLLRRSSRMVIVLASTL